MRNMLSFLENYKKEISQVDSSSARGTKRKILNTSTLFTTAPGTVDTVPVDSCEDLLSYLDEKPESGPSSIQDRTFEISQVNYDFFKSTIFPLTAEILFHH